MVAALRTEERVEVPVVLLGGRDEIRELRQTGLAHRVRPLRDLPGEGLEELVHVGISEQFALQLLARRLACRDPERVVPTHRLDPAVAVVQQLRRSQPLTGAPEAAGHPHVACRDGGHGPRGRHDGAQAGWVMRHRGSTFGLGSVRRCPDQSIRVAFLRKASPSTASASWDVASGRQIEAALAIDSFSAVNDSIPSMPV